MTREEAIDIIKYGMEISKYPSRLTLTVAEVEEAKQMAIKALSQEPCDDAVSRDKERYNKGFYDGYTRATEQANAVIEDIKAEIEGLMSHDDYIVDGFNVLDIIDKHIKRRVKNDKR